MGELRPSLRMVAAITSALLLSSWGTAAAAVAASSATTVLVSRNSTGAEGDSSSSSPSISANGRYVAFSSFATNLVPDVTNGYSQVLVRDVLTGRTRLVSRSSTGAAGNRNSVHPSMSAYGRYVAFSSDARNLVPGDTNGATDVFVRDLVTGRTQLVSRSSTGAQGNGFSVEPSISADGRYVDFESSATDLVPGDNNRAGDVFVRDLIG